MKPRSSSLTPGAVETGNARVGPPADGHQHAIEDLLARDVFAAFKRHADPAGLGLHLHDARIQQHGLHRLPDALGQHVNQVAIGAGQEAARHFDDRDGAAERRVDRAELEADVAAADDQQRLRDVGQVERRGRIHHARVVQSLSEAGTAGTDPVAMIACSNWTVSSPPDVSFTRSVCASVISARPCRY